MKDNKMNITLAAVIFVVVVAVLVFITINKKEESTTGNVVGEQQGNMQNSQQVDGVKVVTIKEGTGAVAKSGDTVSMNYTGKLLDGTVFDSNVDSKFGHVEPLDFTIDAGQVIKGWDIGVTGMKVGEKRTLTITPEYAYGATGAGNIIPPNSTLIFEVELVGIKN